MKNIYEVQSANKIKSAIIITFFALFVFAATYFITTAMGIYISASGDNYGGLSLFGVAMIVSGISTFVSYYYSDKIVLSISGARPANKHEDMMFSSVTENLVLGAGIPMPKLYVIEDTAPNAFATGRDPKHAVVCITTGLLQKLNRSELEGVVAHELSHIRNYDIRLMSVVTVMVGMVALLADWFLRMTWWGGRGRDRDREGGQLAALVFVIGLVFAILSPFIAQLIQLAISRRREYGADSSGVALTRNPTGLIEALKKISSDHEPLEAANKATAHLYIENPFKDKTKSAVGWFSGLFNTHPPIEERIKLLEEMA
jgi:heat shock protein HtpX